MWCSMRGFDTYQNAGIQYLMSGAKLLEYTLINHSGVPGRLGTVSKPSSNRGIEEPTLQQL